MLTTNGIILNEDLAARIALYNEEDLFRFYIPNLKLGKRISSPLRQDSDPSFSVYESYTGSILYHDFKTGETGNLIKFVMNLYGISYIQAMRRIVNDATHGSKVLETKKERHISSVTKKEIKVIVRPFGDKDLMYWEGYGIRKRTLEAYGVAALEAVFLQGELIAEYKTSQPVYGYYMGEGEWKIYKPFSIQRFYTNTNKLQGYAQLPKDGDLLIITKSMKDVMTLRELGYNAVAPHSESVKILKEIDELKSRFKEVIIWFDNDEPGTLGAIALSEILNIPFVLLPNTQHAKDISDYYKANGYEASKQIAASIVCQLNV